MGTLNVPLRMDSDGTIRVGKTRVTLDTLVGAYKRGLSAELIVEHFPAVSLADTYASIAYYLQHQAEVDEYLRKNAVQGEQIRRENEARFDNSALHARLLRELGDELIQGFEKGGK